MKTIQTPTLEVAYEESGAARGRPVILLHGFPDDVHAYDGVAPVLAAGGWRVLVPYLRGYGPTRFRSTETPRSGQQAALGRDLADFMDALDLPRAVVAGYDWGGRAACIVAALWPERVTGLVTMGGYNIQNIAVSRRPDLPATEYRRWYQWYFHTERGRAGLTANRAALCRLLWELLSPNYCFDDATYEQSAPSFENHAWAGPLIVNKYSRTAATRSPELARRASSTSIIAIRSSPRTVTHNSLPFRLKVGSCGSRPTMMPLVSLSGLVVGPACGLGVLPITRSVVVSTR